MVNFSKPALSRGCQAVWLHPSQMCRCEDKPLLSHLDTQAPSVHPRCLILVFFSSPCQHLAWVRWSLWSKQTCEKPPWFLCLFQRVELMSGEGCAMPHPAVTGQQCQPKALGYGDTVLQLVFVLVCCHMQRSHGLSFWTRASVYIQILHCVRLVPTY